MRKASKFLHSLGACGLIGALLAYGVLLAWAPQDTAADYAAVRHSITLLCKYLLVPSLGIVLVTGLISMIVHDPFLKLRWVWVKAFMGLGMFEGTLVLISGRAERAANVSAKVAEGEATAGSLDAVLAYEWQSLGFILAFSLANVVLAVWRPSLSRRRRAETEAGGKPVRAER